MTGGYVGADIEALVREAKLQAMREFIAAMAGKSEQEINDAMLNVRITRTHFDTAAGKVKASMDQEALETAERQAWELLFSQEQRTVLENAVAALKQAELRRGKVFDTADLRSAVYRRQKDWNEIKQLTARLEEDLRA
jgi:transitional endoplasmic reticulum ATPase